MLQLGNGAILVGVLPGLGSRRVSWMPNLGRAQDCMSGDADTSSLEASGVLESEKKDRLLGLLFDPAEFLKVLTA
ncbi:hypothetical protein [Kitasatospora sp. NPDC096204]|uniref:hypothetical protein n=1 Tax=Kitasatospora sp. NPDC096204 TaxID=3364094 RepID=UPI0037FCFAA7